MGVEHRDFPAATNRCTPLEVEENSVFRFSCPWESQGSVGALHNFFGGEDLVFFREGIITELCVCVCVPTCLISQMKLI